MFDTTITVIGNVLTAPEWRHTRTTNTLVVNFKVASTSRRFDRDGGQWVDGPNLRIRVTCWRKLAENVAASVMLGDPVIVHGRLYTRDWTDEEGARHLAYEVEAVSVGHDLARGVARFARRRAAALADVVEASDPDEADPESPADAPAAPPSVVGEGDRVLSRDAAGVVAEVVADELPAAASRLRDRGARDSLDDFERTLDDPTPVVPGGHRVAERRGASAPPPVREVPASH